MKTKTAYKLAIDALTLQQKRYYPGKVEFERSNYLFPWAVKDAKTFEKLEAAKNKMIQLMHQEDQENRQGSLFETTPLPGPGAGEGVQEGKVARTEAQNV